MFTGTLALLHRAHAAAPGVGRAILAPQRGRHGDGTRESQQKTGRARIRIVEHVVRLGFERAANFQSPGSFARNGTKNYELPSKLELNQWALSGRWKVSGDRAALDLAPGRIVFRFRARDLHLVLGPGSDQKPVRFRVLLDGKPPGADHGMDVDAGGVGNVREQRLYQLIRQNGGVQEHEFTIEFLDPHVEAGGASVSSEALTSVYPAAKINVVLNWTAELKR
jgi:hypothetical protein